MYYYDKQVIKNRDKQLANKQHTQRTICFGKLCMVQKAVGNEK